MLGQFKSTVRCPDCDKLSITFDPFMSVSLPIPEIKLVEKMYYWVPFDTGKKCVQDVFRLKSHEPLKSLRKYIGARFNVHPEQFELCIIQDECIKRILPRFEQMAALAGNNIFVFAMETRPEAFQVRKEAVQQQQSIIVKGDKGGLAMVGT